MFCQGSGRSGLRFDLADSGTPPPYVGPSGDDAVFSFLAIKRKQFISGLGLFYLSANDRKVELLCSSGPRVFALQW